MKICLHTNVLLNNKKYTIKVYTWTHLFDVIIFNKNILKYDKWLYL